MELALKMSTIFVSAFIREMLLLVNPITTEMFSLFLKMSENTSQPLLVWQWSHKEADPIHITKYYKLLRAQWKNGTKKKTLVNSELLVTVMYGLNIIHGTLTVSYTHLTL